MAVPISSAGSSRRLMSLPIHVCSVVVMIGASSSSPRRCRGRVLSHSLGCCSHGVYDMLIASAATNIARQGITNLFIARIGILLQEFVSSHQESRRAEATLQTLLLPE